MLYNAKAWFPYLNRTLKYIATTSAYKLSTFGHVKFSDLLWYYHALTSLMLLSLFLFFFSLFFLLSSLLLWFRCSTTQFPNSSEFLRCVCVCVDRFFFLWWKCTGCTDVFQKIRSKCLNVSAFRLGQSSSRALQLFHPNQHEFPASCRVQQRRQKARTVSIVLWLLETKTLLFNIHFVISIQERAQSLLSRPASLKVAAATKKRRNGWFTTGENKQQSHCWL